MNPPTQQKYKKLVLAFKALKRGVSQDEPVPATLGHLTRIVEILIWDQKKQKQFTDFFLENNIYDYFYRLLTLPNISKPSVISLIKLYSFVLLNVEEKVIIHYIFSHQHFNKILKHGLKLFDSDIVFYYVNMLKSVSVRFQDFPIQYFYNQKNPDFPLFTRAVMFYNYPDNLVRTTALNVVFTLIHAKPSVCCQLFQEFPFNSFFVNYFCYVKYFVQKKLKRFQSLSNRNVFVNLQQDLCILIESIDDFFGFKEEKFNAFLFNSFFSFLFVPVLLSVFRIAQKNVPAQQSSFLLFFYLLRHLKNERLKAVIMRIMLEPKISQNFNVFITKKVMDPFFFARDYQISNWKKLFALEPVKAQLRHLFTDFMANEQKTLNTWSSQLTSFNAGSKIVNKDSDFYKQYTQNTGVVSLYAQQEDLLMYQQSSVAELLRNNDKLRTNIVFQLL